MSQHPDKYKLRILALNANGSVLLFVKININQTALKVTFKR